MINLRVIRRDGSEQQVLAPAGINLMEALRDSGIDDLLALCGGCCSCATCHVMIESEHAAGIPAPSADENDLLESSSHREASSRLACQIPLADALDGMVLRFAPEE
jgi:2Fe-2S ferredoxin